MPDYYESIMNATTFLIVLEGIKNHLNMLVKTDSHYSYL